MDRKENIFKRIKNSVSDGSINPSSDRDRILLVLKSLILHLHPPMVNEKTIKFNHTFGLGGMAVVLICLQFITGLLLRFTYAPFPGSAYDSILHLQSTVLFGQLIRNIHHWSGLLLVIITSLHLLRVFFTSGFHGKRQFNWVIGVCLLLLVVFSNFTGYLLPWDQLAYWAVTVATGMLEYIPIIGTGLMEILLGGKQVGSSTLLIFYNLHTGIFPILIILIMAFHFWRVRKAGGVVVPADKSENKMVPAVPNLVAKEFVVMLVLLAFVFLLALIFDAPLLEKANPAFSPNPAKAPWYFLGIQELMLHFHPLFSAIIIPITSLIFLLLIPYFLYETEDNGVWFYSGKGKQLAIRSAVISGAASLAFILINEFLFKSGKLLGFLPDEISNGLIPFIIFMSGFYGFYKFLINKKGANKNEAIQTLVVSILTVFIVLTIVGIFFRGKGMALTF
ncbi:MAG: cytochrome b N-terminal domain-containing protein [Melioribacteraceae bacterium]|nr:cytochrome b N-terminal domain-containing protein [Melioribacteraceae bacterium]